MNDILGTVLSAYIRVKLKYTCKEQSCACQNRPICRKTTIFCGMQEPEERFRFPDYVTISHMKVQSLHFWERRMVFRICLNDFYGKLNLYQQYPHILPVLKPWIQLIYDSGETASLYRNTSS